MSLPGFEDIQGMTPRAKSMIPEFIAFMEHHPKEYAIKSPGIEQALGLNGREVRAITEHLRLTHRPLCSSSLGYYWTDDAAELRKTGAQLEARADKNYRVSTAVYETAEVLEKEQARKKEAAIVALNFKCQEVTGQISLEFSDNSLDFGGLKCNV